MRSLRVLLLALLALACGCGQTAPMFKPTGEPKVRFALRMAKLDPFEGAEEVPVPEERQKFIRTRDDRKVLFVAKTVTLTNADIAGTSPLPDGPAGPVIMIELTPGAKEKFATFTRANVESYLAVFFNDKLEIAPLLREPIVEGRLQLSAPELSKDELTRLAKGLVGE